MKKFDDYLNEIGEVGYVKKLANSVCFVEGLPNLHLNELVIFENGSMGLAFSLGESLSEILFLSSQKTIVGEKVARTGQYTQIGLGSYLLGSMIDPLGNILGRPKPINIEVSRALDVPPQGIIGRKEVNSHFATGVKIVDMTVPVGKGQRELVIGDRKTGKTLFLLQTVLNQAKQGTVCIYAAIGKQQHDIRSILDFIEAQEISDKVVVVASGAAEAVGKIHLTPYTAMTVAEYFRDKGQDTLVILDDLTTHAKYYREISLEARRFPGRSSYPGDIFYIHAKLIERAGNFEKAAITCLPVAESILGDLSGYIQTNLMAMTDGHIYFDIERFNSGQRPAVDPFLSVTRVGLQAHTPLVREINRHISSFLVSLEKMKDFMHFGAEVSDQVRDTIDLGTRLMALFEQDYRIVVPMNLTIFMIGYLWSGKTKDLSLQTFKQNTNEYVKKYNSDQNFKNMIDTYVVGSARFMDLVNKIKTDKNL